MLEHADSAQLTIYLELEAYKFKHSMQPADPYI